MSVDSYLEIYTTLFGWLFYNNLWYVLEDTGLLLLPFVGMVVDYLAAYKKGVESGDAEELAQKGLLLDVIAACLVFMFCGVPYLEFEADEVIFTPSSMQSTFTESQYDVNSNEATYGQGHSFSSYPLSVNVPVFWWLIHDVSVGVTHAVMEGLPPASDLRRYIESLKDIAIENPALRRELSDFKRDCFIPALSKYKEDKPYENTLFESDIQDIFDDHSVEDINWLGSRVFLNIPGYYDSLRAKITIDGFPFDSDRDVEWDLTDPNLPENGMPYCDKWWANSGNGLRERVWDEIPSTTKALSLFNEGIGLATDVREDLLVKVAIYQSPIHFVPRGYDFAYANNSQNRLSWVDSIQVGTKELVTELAAKKERINNSFNVAMFLHATPIFQALMLMLVTIFIPFVLFLSKYSFSSVLTVAWALFSFRFLTACWMLAWWLDQNIIGSLFAKPGAMTEMGIRTEFTFFENDILYYMLNYLYIVIPLIFTIVTGWAGYSVLRGLSAGTMMGGLSGAGASMSNKVSGMIQKAITKKK